MMPSQSQFSYNPSDVAGAWEDARSTAAFASSISVNCMEEGHYGEECSIRTTANEIAARSLELARELTKSAVAA